MKYPVSTPSLKPNRRPCHVLPKRTTLARSQQQGLSLIELAVTVVISGIILSVALSLIVNQRRQYLKEQANTEVDQTLQAAMEAIGTDIRQVGERIEPGVPLPGVRIQNGSGTAPDQLVLQRKLVAEQLPICETVSGNPTTLTVSLTAGTGDCQFKNGNANPLPDNLEQWQNYRCGQDQVPGCQSPAPVCTQTGGSSQECSWAYLYDPASGTGEFLLYHGEEQDALNPNTFKLKRVPLGNLARTYTYDPAATGNQPQLYILEERRYFLSAANAEGDRTLRLSIVNNRDNTTYDIVNRLRNFQVQGLRNSTWQDNLNATGVPTVNWQTLEAIRISLDAFITGPDSASQGLQNLTSQYYPRNSLSRP